MSEVLKAESLTRTLSGEIPVTLVDNISIAFHHGEFACIMGPSGSGKSSLLYLLGLLDLPTSGKIYLDQEDTTRFSEQQLARKRLEKLGFVFQFHFLLAEFSCLENVALPMKKLGGKPEYDIHLKAQSLLEQLGVGDQAKKFPHQLSGGQRQRVAIARALINDPLIILADEPTGNLDTASGKIVQNILGHLAHEMGKTVIAVTHDPTFAAHADRKIILVDGKLNPDWQPT
jgi:lipoprotein-releasing system ATP-binding protein